MISLLLSGLTVMKKHRLNYDFMALL